MAGHTACCRKEAPSHRRYIHIASRGRDGVGPRSRQIARLRRIGNLSDTTSSMYLSMADGR